MAGEKRSIRVSPNTFYIKKDVEDGLPLSETYPDTYNGSLSTSSIKSGDKLQYFLVDSDVIDKPTYGVGNITEAYMHLFVDKITNTNYNHPPKIKTYKVADTVNISEGSLTIEDENILHYTSFLDAEDYLLNETFDGTDKGFGNQPAVPRGSFMPGYYQYYFYIDDFNATLGYNWTAWKNGVTHIGTSKSNRESVHRTPEGATMGSISGVTPTGVLQQGGQSWYQTPILLRGPNKNGHYKPSVQFWTGKTNSYTKIDGPNAPLSWWQSEVNIKSVLAGQTVTEKMVGEDTYKDSVTQFNSIFTQTMESKSARDIKVQSLEDTGDNERAYTNARIEFTSDDSMDSSGQSVRYHLFWENYSGDTTGTVGTDNIFPTANPFGFSTRGAPVSMQAVSSIDGIPMCYPNELAAPYFGTTGPLGDGAFRPEGPLARGEVEISLKLTNLWKTAYRPKDSAGASNSTPTAARAFFMVFSNIAFPSNANFHQWLYNMASGTTGYADANYGGLVFWVKDVESNEIYCTTLNSASYASLLEWGIIGTPKQESYIPNIETGSSADNVQVPFNEWFTVRFKMPQFDDLSKVVSCYFPTLVNNEDTPNLFMTLNDNSIKPYTTSGSGGNPKWISNLTLAATTIRSINTGSSVAGSVDYSYETDLTADEDNTLEVLVNNISFRQWNNTIQNGTRMTNSNDMPLTLPSPTLIIPQRTNVVDEDEGGVGYEANATAPSPVTLSFGFDDTDVAAGKYLFLQDYVTSNQIDNNIIADEYIKGGYSSYGQLGCFPYKQGTAATLNTEIATSTHSVSGNIQVSGANFLVDSFNQKGFIKVTSGTAWPSAGGNPWVSRENPFVKAHTIRISEDGTTVEVDKPEIFDVPYGTASGTRFVVLIPGQSYNDLKKNKFGKGYTDATELYMTEAPRGNIIKFNRSILTDLYDNPLGVFSISGSNNYATKIVISPKKYWIWLHMMNAQQDNQTGVVTTAGQWGRWAANYTGIDYDLSGSMILNNPIKTYSASVRTAGTGTAGSTYNEYLYNDGANINTWSWERTAKSEIPTMLELGNNYGYGQSSEVAPAAGFFADDYITTFHNYLDFSKYVRAQGKGVKYGSRFPFLFMSTYDELATSDETIDISFRTDDDSTGGLGFERKLDMVYGIETTLPVVSNLMVSPSVDLLNSTDINEDANSTAANVIFTWEEEADEKPWYRMLWVDTDLIENKYHTANFIAPMNNPPADGGTTSGGSAYFYETPANFITNTNKRGIQGSNFADIEGFQGYGSKFDGNVMRADNLEVYPKGAATQFTFTCHLKPTTGAVRQVPIHLSGTGGGGVDAFKITLNASNRILVGLAGSTQLTSTTAYECDGNQPLAVVVTYDKSLDNNNLKLFVNGKLEDTADYTTNFTTSGQLWIGAEGPASGAAYSGFIEEITFHTRCAYVPSNTLIYQLPTKQLADLSGSASNFYNAKMFLFDYHNIRGASPTQVAESNLTAWKVTGV